MPPIPESIPERDQELIQDLLDQKPPEFTDLTLTQHEAFADSVLDDGNHLLIAETGNGKTFVAEAVTKKALQNGDNVAYLVPSVSLVTEKYQTVSAWTPGDVTVNKGHGYAQANVVVATFESFYEAVVRGYANRFDTVILDDFHEIYSSHRGANIEKGISAALESGMELLGISATVGNPHTIARWLDADLTISSEKRAVPIEETPVETTEEKYAQQLARLIRSHEEKGPFLIFNNQRSYTESRARGLSKLYQFETDHNVDFEADIKEAISTELTDEHRTLISMLTAGVGYHHAGLEDGIKELIEQYIDEGVIQCVCCTTTLSYGFDSPVQSVIVADLKHWTGEFIGVYEYVQWVGRAGRDADKYDQAYAFCLFGDENASEQFQFDTPIEEKDLEDVETHLSGQSTLRWLVLELVAYGWESDQEVMEFIRSTLYWSETVEQIPQHLRTAMDVEPGKEITEAVSETLAWLTRQGLVNQIVTQPQAEKTRYEATDQGRALVEYEHSNWFDNTIESVLSLSEWLSSQEGELTPEALVQRLAAEYYHCDAGLSMTGGGTLGNWMSAHDLADSEGTTAALGCWLWCEGMSVGQIEDRFGLDISGFAGTMGNLSTAIESLSHLFTPIDMPTEPEWLGTLAAQIEAGVPGPDMYLLDAADQLGRYRYNTLKDQIDTTGGSTSDWDPGVEAYLIERLSALLSENGESLFLDTVREAESIGQVTSENVLDAVSEWDPSNDSRAAVPFSQSIRSRDSDVELVRYHGADESGGETSGETERTTLGDFS